MKLFFDGGDGNGLKLEKIGQFFFRGVVLWKSLKVNTNSSLCHIIFRITSVIYQECYTNELERTNLDFWPVFFRDVVLLKSPKVNTNSSLCHIIFRIISVIYQECYTNELERTNLDFYPVLT